MWCHTPSYTIQHTISDFSVCVPTGYTFVVIYSQHMMQELMLSSFKLSIGCVYDGICFYVCILMVYNARHPAEKCCKLVLQQHINAPAKIILGQKHASTDTHTHKRQTHRAHAVDRRSTCPTCDNLTLDAPVPFAQNAGGPKRKHYVPGMSSSTLG